ncbi:patatin-like protein 2 [Alnus glutinosa]|uniref:patatin-like protein 2 n=1 Tax=Alnus glutinosa TaxID=3517 RepID=UPI002D77AFA9|nr:patatin-like protein 2 [Alnus glutinosa]
MDRVVGLDQTRKKSHALDECVSILTKLALVAMGEVSKEIIRGSPDFFPIKPMDYGRFLVISLGTGSLKPKEKYKAPDAAKWGILGWLTKGGSTPIIDVFSQASGDMVDVHLSVVFQALHSEKSYLRIQAFVTLHPYIHNEYE